MLAKDSIRESPSLAAAPLLLIAKLAGGVHIYQDYCGFNKITIKNRSPLALIRETLGCIAGAKLFTKLDVIATFNRIRIAEGHE